MIIIKVICDECKKSYDIEKDDFLNINKANNYKCPNCGSYGYSIRYVEYSEEESMLKIKD